MNKDKLLAMSRAEKNDEGMEHAYMQGLNQGFFWMSTIFGLLSVINLIVYYTRKLNTIHMDVAGAMYFCFTASIQFQKYRFTGNKKQRIYGILNAGACIFFIVLYLIRAIWK